MATRSAAMPHMSSRGVNIWATVSPPHSPLQSPERPSFSVSPFTKAPAMPFSGRMTYVINPIGPPNRLSSSRSVAGMDTSR
eukprot:4584303-Prymnesium_polylepis.2